MIFDINAANAAKLEGMARAYDAAPGAWREEAHEVVQRLAEERPEFTTDDVWRVLWQPPEPRALGPVMLIAAKNKLIEKTGRQHNSARPVCHAAPLTVWRSLIYRGPH